MTCNALTALSALAVVASSGLAQITFNPSVNIAAGTRPGGVAAADFDGDGDVDYAVTIDGPDRIQIFNNDGAGGFTAGAVIFTGANTGAGALVAADLDGDTDADIAVALQNTNSVAIYTNVGGTFGLAGSTAVGANPRGLTAGDMDDDGDLDL
ncbi:MAG: VCBS repeat-containing protein, partial [Phycisphaerales bacterium]|nr:VCBS repeat-containing protein [Phycisphaerales bacterium]